MTGPDDSEAGTRPISVAELLAKNGTIGAAPPGGGRRRRRRGNSDAVTVAELTGEIPIVRTGEIPVVRDEPRAEPAAEPDPAPPEPEAVAETGVEPDATPHTNGSTPPATRPASPPELADQPVARRGKTATPERSHYPLPIRRNGSRSVASAETMSPDPIVDESPDTDPTEAPDLDPALDDTDFRDTDEQPDELGIGDASYLQTYLRATSGPLFGGQTVADDLARRGVDDADLTVGEELEVAEALEEHDDAGKAADKFSEGESDRTSRGQLVVRGLLIAVQSIVAVVFGAGLFIAFDQLWKWNSIVALILGVLVILGLVVGVRVVRKTEDIGSTLTAVAVGALVTFGPLALLQAS
jgi:F0F1-type ATP synthase assembly protein I